MPSCITHEALLKTRKAFLNMERVPQHGKRSCDKESVPDDKEIVPQSGNSWDNLGPVRECARAIPATSAAMVRRIPRDLARIFLPVSLSYILRL
jgi:hypothetical protein